VTEDQDLRVLGGVASHKQRQPAEHPDFEQVDQTDEHESRAKAAGQAMRRVLAADMGGTLVGEKSVMGHDCGCLIVMFRVSLR
jgi:hypothetical protein